MIKKVYGYIRVSTGEQGRKFSLNAQKDEINRYCVTNGLVLVQVFEDQASGMRLRERGGLMALLDSLYDEVHAVVATEADRLARDVFQFGWLVTHLGQRNVEVLLINDLTGDTAAERAFARIRTVFSEFEHELRQERIARGVRLAREYQKFMNRPPFGYRMENGKIVPCKEQADKVEQVFRSASNGQSIRSIARELSLTRSTVSRMLKNRFYVSSQVNGTHEPIISVELWDAVQSSSRDSLNSKA